MKLGRPAIPRGKNAGQALELLTCAPSIKNGAPSTTSAYRRPLCSMRGIGRSTSGDRLARGGAAGAQRRKRSAPRPRAHEGGGTDCGRGAARARSIEGSRGVPAKRARTVTAGSRSLKGPRASGGRGVDRARSARARPTRWPRCWVPERTDREPASSTRAGRRRSCGAARARRGSRARSARPVRHAARATPALPSSQMPSNLSHVAAGNDPSKWRISCSSAMSAPLAYGRWPAVAVPGSRDASRASATA